MSLKYIQDLQAHLEIALQKVAALRQLLLYVDMKVLPEVPNLCEKVNSLIDCAAALEP